MAAKRRPVKKRELMPADIKAELITSLKYAAMFFIALLFWELILRTQTGFEDISFYFVLFLPAEAVFLSALTGWFKPKYNRIATPIVMLLPFAYYVSQLIYFRIFGSLFSVSMLGLGTDAVENFGWALWSTVKESVLWIFVCLIPVIVAGLFSYSAPRHFFKKFRPELHLFSVFKTVILWLLAVAFLLPFGTKDGTPYAAYSSSYVDTDTASSQIGALTNSIVELGYRLFGSTKKDEDASVLIPNVPEPPKEPTIDSSPNVLSGLDFATLKGLTNDKGKQQLCDYFASVSPTNKNEWTGKLKDYNLIYICAESFSKYAIDPVVTPTLYKLSHEGFKLNNFYNSFKNTTTNGEFALMTGLWADVSRDADCGTASGSFPQSKDKLIPFALGNMYENSGAKAYAYHNFRGYYYSRNKTHPNLGYSTTRFMGGTNGMHFTTSWPSSDLEMMEQSVSDYINNDRFHAYYMTFSGHGPYSDANPIAVRNLATVRELLNGRDLPSQAEYYLAANYELEKAMKYLMDELEKAGKLNKTMIIIAGDHYPYYLKDSALNALAGEKVEQNFDKFKSTCIMWAGGIETVEVNVPVCNVDILPSVLNLLGMEYDSRLLPGADMFSSNEHIAMFYNKTFVTEKVKYNAQKATAEWLPASAGMTEEQKKAYLDYCIAATKSRYTASLELMSEDFYRFVYENIKTSPEEENTSSVGNTSSKEN